VDERRQVDRQGRVLVLPRTLEVEDLGVGLGTSKNSGNSDAVEREAALQKKRLWRSFVDTLLETKAVAAAPSSSSSSASQTGAAVGTANSNSVSSYSYFELWRKYAMFRRQALTDFADDEAWRREYASRADKALESRKKS